MSDGPNLEIDETYFTAHADTGELQISYQVTNNSEWAMGEHTNVLTAYADGNEIARHRFHHEIAMGQGDNYRDMATLPVQSPIQKGTRVEFFVTLDEASRGDIDLQTWCVAIDTSDGPH